MMKKDETTSNDVIDEFESLRADVARLVAAMSELTERHAQPVDSHVADMFHEARNKVANAASDAMDHARAASHEIGKSIERNPMTALIIAFGIGLAIALV